jgi:hypothetical protein
MHRVIVYDSALPQTTDILNTNLFAMLGQSYLLAALFGYSGVVCEGLLCAPTSPASLNVTVGIGSIYEQDEIDANAYGDLGVNTGVVMKQGILTSPVTLSITPPSTSGYSQVFLVQAELQDIDAGPQVLAYYNAANPAVPYSGPNNNGSSQYTQRTCVVTIGLKAGAAAPTGTQTTPSPDAGFTGLYAITVSNGQSTITSANISQLVTAPLRNDGGGAAFFPRIQDIPPDVQNQMWVGFDDTGSANAPKITPYPPFTSIQKYQKVVVKMAYNNTGASTLTVVMPSGNSTIAITLPSGSALSGGELKAGSIAEYTYNGSTWELTSAPANMVFSGGATPNSTYLTGVVGVLGSAASNTKAASWTVQQIVAAVTLGGTAYQGNNLSLSFSGASTGANGMDTGSMPVSGDISIYAIYNPTTATWATLGVAGTTSNGQLYTGSHMPSGYTASRLLFSGCTDSSGNFLTDEDHTGGTAWVQINNTVYITSSNFLSNGGATTGTSVSLAGLIPANALTLAGNWNCQNPSGGGAAAALGGTVGYGTGGGVGQGMIGVQWLGAFATTSTNFGFIPLITASTLYYAVSASGVEVSLAVDSYTF